MGIWITCIVLNKNMMINSTNSKSHFTMLKTLKLFNLTNYKKQCDG